jgi:hypothetical protein
MNELDTLFTIFISPVPPPSRKILAIKNPCRYNNHGRGLKNENKAY